MLSATWIDWCSRQWFSLVHRNTLIYNACWEDPRIDREALGLGPDDTLLTIASAGCNALDFALEGVRKVWAVDVNPRQTALLELKMAAIRELDHETFFALFGRGRLEGFRELYRARLRPQLTPISAAIWDRQQGFFDPGSSFYYQGSAGLFARGIGHYLDFARVRDCIAAIFETDSLAEQQYLYRNVLKKAFWTGFLKAALNWDLPFSFIGVPRVQRRRLEETYEGGVCRFLEDCLDAVFGQLPLKDNYFWWLYCTGSYTPTRCPRYLEPHHFAALKAGLVDRIQVSTESLNDFLQRSEDRISRYVLLDHMDWLHGERQPVLDREWQLLLDRAAPDARFLWRSAAPDGNFVDDIRVRRSGACTRVGDALRYDTTLAARLQKKDRVHTYAGLSVATLQPGWIC